MVCAMQNSPLRASETILAYTPANVIQADFTNVNGIPAGCLSPIASELLPPSAQNADDVALWFSNLAFKSSPAVKYCDPAGSYQANNISTSCVVTFISRNTFYQTLENHFSWSV